MPYVIHPVHVAAILLRHGYGYYARVSAIVSERLGPAPIAGELARATDEFARFVETIAAP